MPVRSGSSAADDASTADLLAQLRAAIRDVPDFPRSGISFKDVTPLLASAELFALATERMALPFRDRGITHVAAIESRGFILGAPVAQHLGVGFIPLRKPGKLPSRTRRVEYALEYGSDALEAHEDACPAPARVLVVDDVLATGGTAAAACQLLEAVGGQVLGCSFLLTLSALGGVARLPNREIASVLTF